MFMSSAAVYHEFAYSIARAFRARADTRSATPERRALGDNAPEQEKSPPGKRFSMMPSKPTKEDVPGMSGICRLPDQRNEPRPATWLGGLTQALGVVRPVSLLAHEF